MKKLIVLLLSVGLSFSFFAVNGTGAKATMELEEKQMMQPYKLKSNEAYLYYMYSNEKGHYFLDPSAEYENVIFVDLDFYYIPQDMHGHKVIGVFEDDTKWDLEDIKEVE